MNEQWVYTIYDKDGEEMEWSTETYDTQSEAEEGALFWVDDVFYGSHEVYKL